MWPVMTKLGAPGWPLCSSGSDEFQRKRSIQERRHDAASLFTVRNRAHYFQSVSGANGARASQVCRPVHHSFLNPGGFRGTLRGRLRGDRRCPGQARQDRKVVGLLEAFVSEAKDVKAGFVVTSGNFNIQNVPFSFLAENVLTSDFSSYRTPPPLPEQHQFVKT